jgi:hypothetical protein
VCARARARSAALAQPESAGAGAGTGEAPHGREEVTRAGYREMHMRIAQLLMPPNEQGSGFLSTDADLAEAHQLADKDWAEDIARFSGHSHITVWLADIREKFVAACSKAVGRPSPALLMREMTLIARFARVGLGR